MKIGVSVLVSLGCVALLWGCAPRVVKVASSLPAAVQMQLLHVPRIWVAGFVASAGADRIDLNSETVRFLRQELRNMGAVAVVDAEPLVLDSKGVFEDDDYWRRLAEEHGVPLVVTGSVNLLLAPASIVQRGRRIFYLGRAGRVLDATVVVIDGRTGHVIDTQPLRRRIKYADRDVSLGLALYLDMMKQSRADWLNAMTQSSH